MFGYAEQVPALAADFSGNGYAGTGAYLQLLDSGGSLALQFNVGTASATFVSSASWADGNWHHVAASWDGSTAIGYLDGVQIGSSGTALTATMTAGSADVTVGAATDQPGDDRELQLLQPHVGVRLPEPV